MVAAAVFILVLIMDACHAWVPHQPTFSSPVTPRHSATTLWMSDSPPPPTTFREAEVLGLRLMQEGDYEGALDGTFLIYE